MKLIWHNYRYYPYERELASREIAALLQKPYLREVPGGVELSGDHRRDLVRRLTYVSKIDGARGVSETHQSCLETAARAGKHRQATRYSVHGLHEYKGKFNPQVAKALLNIFGVMPGEQVLDPFCGSGTTLVECAHIGVFGWGVDVNPLAVFISNAKLRALATPAADLKSILSRLANPSDPSSHRPTPPDQSPRYDYLKSWFDIEVLWEIEDLRCRIQSVAGKLAPVFLTVASNLLRQYSQQDPNDLRVRRRKSPLPSAPFLASFLDACEHLIRRVDAAQAVLQPFASGVGEALGRASLSDAAAMSRSDSTAPFDAAITSPPYATALPYIDIHRLSLVWLGLAAPSEIAGLETVLIGSRELRGLNRREMIDSLERNSNRLPQKEVALCRELASALDTEDGFRRQSVPILLYRYFSSMRTAMRSVREVLRPQAPFGLIVGCNHTVLGGQRYDIDTPEHLASLATDAGWRVEEQIPLQTYHRYGYHMGNAIARETLLMLRKA